MVNSVMAVSATGKIKRDNERSRATLNEKNKEHSKGLFSEFLKQEVEEQKEAPHSCSTVMYGQDSRLHTFEYQKREYHY